MVAVTAPLIKGRILSTVFAPVFVIHSSSSVIGNCEGICSNVVRVLQRAVGCQQCGDRVAPVVDDPHQAAVECQSVGLTTDREGAEIRSIRTAQLCDRIGLYVGHPHMLAPSQAMDIGSEPNGKGT